MNVKFPISIGLVGAPGSGKDRLATEFFRKSEDFFLDHRSRLHCIQNSGISLERYYNQAMGVSAGYRDELWAQFHRLEKERHAQGNGLSFLSCGTLLDTLAHAGANMENMVEGIQTPDLAVRLQRQQMAMVMLTNLLPDFRYTFVFYLPLKPSVIVAGQDQAESNYATRVDLALKTLFEAFNLPLQELNGTPEENAATMLSTIKTIVEYEDPGEKITEDIEPLSDELKEELAAAGIELPDWKPEVPPKPVDTLSE